MRANSEITLTLNPSASASWRGTLRVRFPFSHRAKGPGVEGKIRSYWNYDYSTVNFYEGRRSDLVQQTTIKKHSEALVYSIP
jgi:hypothetical protein